MFELLSLDLVVQQVWLYQWKRCPHQFWTHPMELLGDMDHVESHFFLCGDSVSVGAR
jgi:hypothetical protein